MSIDRSALPGQETLLESWRTLAQMSPGARLIRSSATTAAVFPAWKPLNNAILLDSHDGIGAASAVVELERIYAAAGVDAWALWVPSRAVDLDAADEIRKVGHLTRETTTLVMEATLGPGMRLHEEVVRTSLATAARVGDRPVARADLAPPDALQCVAAWAMLSDGVAVAGAWSFLHGSDCGVYAVGTAARWRRRGLARALVEHVLADAQERGARSATLQSTRMAQRLYASLGFEPVGRYEEWCRSSAPAARLR